ncbi:MAG: hypothetical protein KAH77_01440, partial [Thiomargarita sp.]|nr:hypothetical protein [Thiomargarita sp.]
GLGRLDLCIEFANERFAFELKLSRNNALTLGTLQLTEYLDKLSLETGWLIIFSRGKITDWDKVGKMEAVNNRITVIWM